MRMLWQGKGIEKEEVSKFKDKAEYENSSYFLDIKKNLTVRKGRENGILTMSIIIASLLERGHT